MSTIYRYQYAAKLFRLIKELEALQYPDHEQLTNMRIEYQAMIGDEELKAMSKTHHERYKFVHLGHKSTILDWKPSKKLITI